MILIKIHKIEKLPQKPEFKSSSYIDVGDLKLVTEFLNVGDPI